ncbi:MAG: LarC family nickel insertion protein, partial [Nitrospirae bacterium]|nr:LarC family nickel insertion protein [Nitrospirota bacterium]
ISGLGVKACPVPLMKIDRIGYGAGNKDALDMPNVLRLIIGEASGEPNMDSVMIIEANIDDMNPQIYEHVMDRLFSAGASDVFLENIIMKKGRPAVKLSVITKEEYLEKLKAVFFEETTTIGLRFQRIQRTILERECADLKTRYGTVRIKASKMDGRIINLTPEYEDLREIANRTKMPIKKITEEIIKDYAKIRYRRQK